MDRGLLDAADDPMNNVDPENHPLFLGNTWSQVSAVRFDLG